MTVFRTDRNGPHSSAPVASSQRVREGWVRLHRDNGCAEPKEDPGEPAIVRADVENESATLYQWPVERENSPVPFSKLRLPHAVADLRDAIVEAEPSE